MPLESPDEDRISPEEYFSPMPMESVHHPNKNLIADPPVIIGSDHSATSDIRTSSHLPCKENTLDDNTDPRESNLLWDKLNDFRDRYRRALDEILPCLDGLVRRKAPKDRDRFRNQAEMCGELLRLKRTTSLPSHITRQHIAEVHRHMALLVEAYVDSMIKEE